MKKDTPLICFCCKNDTHSYTWEAWRVYPSSRTSVYTFIMEVTPPPSPVTANTNTEFRGGWYPGYHPPCPPPLTRENRKWAWQYEGTCTYFVVLSGPHLGRPLPRGKVHTQDSRYPRTLWTPQTNLDVISLRSVAFVPVFMYLMVHFYKTVNAKIVASLDVTR